MQAKDVMTASVVTVTPDTTVMEIAEILLGKRISAVPVLEEDGRLVGIVSEGDLIRRTETGTERRESWWLAMLRSPEDRAIDYVRSHGRKASDVMSCRLVTVTEETPVAKIAALLEEHGIKRVPVVRGDHLVGVVSRADLLRALVTVHAEPVDANDAAIRKAILARVHDETGARDSLFNVSVDNGTAHLWGAMETEAERRAVLVAAETTPGVTAVITHLRILRVLHVA